MEEMDKENGKKQEGDVEAPGAPPPEMDKDNGRNRRAMSKRREPRHRNRG